MAYWLPQERFPELLDVLRDQGYRVVGPRAREGAIVFEPLEAGEAPAPGLNDEQGPGHYRLRAGNGRRRFAWAVGPQALKPLTFAPRESLWRVQRDGSGRLWFTEDPPAATPTAVVGLRACDLAALALQDRHFLGGPRPDAHYAARRAALLLVAVHCARPAATCFCASTGDGPAVDVPCDLVLGELDDGYVLDAGSEAGARVLGALPLDVATPTRMQAVRAETDAAARAQTRRLPGRHLKDTLFARLEHPRWDAVADRCLACGNCTAVCPTCFCHREGETADLGGDHSRHWREWDSCFLEGHGYIHGFQTRPDTRLRYRQWLTHKLGGWHDQYGRSGCVGCGRCITWCPVGIDITEEAAAVCGSPE